MQNYTNIQKFLHDFVLGKKLINKSLFELEKIFFLKKKKIEDFSHIFITGLPRSGTTTLLNFIFSSNQYASLKYKNMPFILSPNFSKLFNEKKIEKKERFHGDGIFYDLNSPEAFDEIFLNNDENFIKKEFINYIELICLSEKKNKYLSKNNFNYKRINLISSILPHSKFLIPIREPMNHAFSLLNQHLHFTKLQKKNNFVKRYMHYLGHTEFGLTHRPWNNSINYFNSNEINYWLEQWCFFYKNLLLKYNDNKNCYFVIYEKLTNQDYVKKLVERLSLDSSSSINLGIFKNSNKKNFNVNFSQNLYTEAKDIYFKFIKGL